MIPVRHRLPAVLLLASATLLASPASADQPRRNASAETFSFCREQEKAGDAQACWAVWLQKYRTTGNEAEIAYAEMHPAAPKKAVATTARLQLTSMPSAAVTLDGRPLGMTPRESIDVPPGEHRITFANKSRIEGRTITVTPGEERVVDVQFEAPRSGVVAGPPPPKPAPPASGNVLDFCALSPAKGSRKERVVLFSPSGTGRINDSAELRALDGAAVVRDVFTARFALDRFHNVLGSFPARKGWEQREAISLGELRAFLRETHEQAGATSEQEARAERERRFITYSLGCADYVAIPAITSLETKWETPKASAEDGAAPGKALAVSLNAAVGIFRRKGDSFERIALLTASAPTFGASHHEAPSSPEGLEAGAGEDAAARILPGYLSGVPEPACLVGRAPAEGVAGLVTCGIMAEGTAEQALGSRDERGGPACIKARDENTPEAERATLAAQCELRTRTYQLARAFHADARKVEGWQLFGVLAHSGAPPSLVLGRDDGLKIGDAFQVLGEHDERLAFYKVAQLGPGGPAGARSHTLLTARSGDATTGSRLDAYPQVGVSITPYASIGMLAFGDGTTHIASGDAVQELSLPDVVFGGGILLGYDVSSLVRSSDTFVRAGVGVFAGSGVNTTMTLVPLDLWVEKDFYLARRLSLVTAVGGTMQLGSVNLLTALENVPEDIHVSSTMFGPAARVGLDIMLHPDWSLKLEGVARVPLTAATYTESDGKPVPPEWLARQDHLATLAFNLGIAKTF